MAIGLTGVSAISGEGLGLLIAYMPTQSYDVVVFVNDDGDHVFVDARPRSISVKENAKVWRHPVESGAVTSDGRVIEPLTIEVAVTLKPKTYAETYQEIKAFYLSNDLISIQTKTDFYSNMVLASMPHEENPDHYDTITMVLRFEEVIIVTTSTGDLPASSTQNGGNKNAKPVESAAAKKKVEDNGTIAYQLFGHGGSGHE